MYACKGNRHTSISKAGTYDHNTTQNSCRTKGVVLSLDRKSRFKKGEVGPRGAGGTEDGVGAERRRRGKVQKVTEYFVTSSFHRPVGSGLA